MVVDCEGRLVVVGLRTTLSLGWACITRTCTAFALFLAMCGAQGPWSSSAWSVPEMRDCVYSLASLQDERVRAPATFPQLLEGVDSFAKPPFCYPAHLQMGNSFKALLARSSLFNFSSVPGDKTERCPTTMRCLVAPLCRALAPCLRRASTQYQPARRPAPKNPCFHCHQIQRIDSALQLLAALPLPTSGSVPCARLSLRSKLRG